MLRASQALILVATIAVMAPACHHRRGAPTVEPPADITLQVTNHNWLDVTIYVVHDGVRTRVGLVTASSDQAFTLSAQMVGQSHELVLIGEAVGSRDTARTDVLSVQPGQLIEWTLETDLRRSSVGVY